MHGEDVPAVAAEGLREVDVLLVAGEAVEQDDGGMRLRAGGEEEEALDVAAVGGEDGFEILRGCGGVGRGVGGDGGLLLREKCAGEERKGCGGKDFADSHVRSMRGGQVLVQSDLCGDVRSVRRHRVTGSKVSQVHDTDWSALLMMDRKERTRVINAIFEGHFVRSRCFVRCAGTCVAVVGGLVDVDGERADADRTSCQ